jgi:hypothetical protein
VFLQLREALGDRLVYVFRQFPISVIGTERISITFNQSNLSQHVKVRPEQIAAALRERLQPDDELDDSDGKLVLTTPVTIPRRGGERRVEGWEKPDWTTATVRHDVGLIKALIRAHEWRKLIEVGEILTLEDLSARFGHDRKYVRHTLKLAFLAPDIQRAIPEGRQPRSLSAPALSEADLPMLWSEQRTLLSFAAT